MNQTLRSQQSGQCPAKPAQETCLQVNHLEAEQVVGWTGRGDEGCVCVCVIVIVTDMALGSSEK